jgi:transcriptional regulator with XRE-family HTH domain
MTPALSPRRPAPTWGFGDRLRLVRRDLGLSQAEMSIRIGVGAKSYSSWESGQARPADLPAMAETLEAATGVDRAWWLGWADGGSDGEGTKVGTDRDGQMGSVTHQQLIAALPKAA